MGGDEQQVDRRLAAVVALDVAGYSRLMGVDEETTLSRLKAARSEVVDPALTEFGGRLVKASGDGFLCEFPSAVAAVGSAVAIQKAMAQRELDWPTDDRLRFRIGINLGDVIVDGDDIYGDGVNIAARLEEIAEPGGICIADLVRGSMRGRVDIALVDGGEPNLKNISEPIQIWRWLPPGLERKSNPRWRTMQAGKPSIAVLPFENISGDSEQEYFAEGISEDLLTELSRNDELLVIGRHSSFAFKGAQVSLRQIGQELGAKYIVEGSVRRSSNRVRITAQLVDTATDKHLWAERFDRDLEDIFEIQEAVTKAIADQLSVRLKPENAERSYLPTGSLDAYEAYSRGRLMINPPTPDNLIDARRTLRRVIELDPDFSGGYAGLSSVHSYLVIFNFSDDPEHDSKLAREFAEKSVALDDRLGWPHIAMGLCELIDRNHAGAVAAGERAVEAQPSDPESLAYLGFFRFLSGDGDGAVEANERAFELNPKYVKGLYLIFQAVGHWVSGRLQESDATFRRNVNRGGFVGRPAMVVWTAALQESGRNKEAESVAAELLRMNPLATIQNIPPIKHFAMEEHRIRLRNALRVAGIPDK